MRPGSHAYAIAPSCRTDYGTRVLASRAVGKGNDKDHTQNSVVGIGFQQGTLHVVRAITETSSHEELERTALRSNIL